MDEKGNFERAALFKNLEREETEQGDTLLVNINILSAVLLTHKSGLIYVAMSYMCLIHTGFSDCMS